MTRCLVLFGPTASGKSAAATALAERYGGTVINADSMQVYRDLRILTARPSEAEEAAVPHRLYGTLDGAEICTAQRWRAMATEEIGDAIALGRVPILCGGTGFYIKALTVGLSSIPEIPEDVREAVRARVEQAPVDSWEHLRVVDPAAASKIEPMDRQRVARALEVLAATDRPLSAWQADPPDGPPTGLSFTTITLNPPRKQLTQRCDARFDTMLESGALEEVEALLARNLSLDRPLMRAVGVPELAAYLRGDCTLDAAAASAKTATRRYAKRQVTWLKGQFVSDFIMIEQVSESSVPKIFAFIEENGLIRG